MAHVLVVDDETSIVMVLKDMLTRLGYDVLSASNGVDALKMISAGNIDLVITDIVMPDMDGIELIKEVRKQFPTVKIVAISGGSTESGPKGYLEEAEALGATQCLSKPFMLSELSSLVKALLNEDQEK